MNARLLAGLAAREWGVLKDAEDELVKKARGCQRGPGGELRRTLRP